MILLTVACDIDKNNILYHIDLEEWIKYMDFVGSDSICSMELRRNNGDYSFKYKNRFNENSKNLE